MYGNGGFTYSLNQLLSVYCSAMSLYTVYGKLTIKKGRLKLKAACQVVSSDEGNSSGKDGD